MTNDTAGGVAGVFTLLGICTVPTPLYELHALATRCGVARIVVKDESRRFLGNFKSLGGLHAAFRALSRRAGIPLDALLDGACRRESLPALICASDGNHGLAVAAAAELVGTSARVYLADGVPEPRARRLQERHATCVRVAGTYDDAVDAAARAAANGEGLLVADTTDAQGDAVFDDIVEGYDLLAQEISAQLPRIGNVRPTHAFVQAGVGGLAASMAQGLTRRLTPCPRIVIVEPATARCVGAAIASGYPRQIPGDLASAADMLSCGRASRPALEILLRHRAISIGVDETTLASAVETLARAGGPPTTPSGAAGLAGLIAARSESSQALEIGIDARSEILLIITEGPIARPNSFSEE